MPFARLVTLKNFKEILNLKWYFTYRMFLGVGSAKLIMFEKGSKLDSSSFLD